jgi:hypothetical protein
MSIDFDCVTPNPDKPEPKAWILDAGCQMLEEKYNIQ